MQVGAIGGECRASKTKAARAPDALLSMEAADCKAKMEPIDHPPKAVCCGLLAEKASDENSVVTNSFIDGRRVSPASVSCAMYRTVKEEPVLL